MSDVTTVPATKNILLLIVAGFYYSLEDSEGQNFFFIIDRFELSSHYISY